MLAKPGNSLVNTQEPNTGDTALNIVIRRGDATYTRFLLQHGADAAVLAELELAYSLAEMVMATPPYRPQRS